MVPMQLNFGNAGEYAKFLAKPLKQLWSTVQDSADVCKSAFDLWSVVIKCNSSFVNDAFEELIIPYAVEFATRRDAKDLMSRLFIPEDNLAISYKLAHLHLPWFCKLFHAVAVQHSCELVAMEKDTKFCAVLWEFIVNGLSNMEVNAEDVRKLAKMS